LHPTCYSGLRPLPQAGELKRWVAAINAGFIPIAPETV
jgi:hypothetical protein